MMGQLFGSHVVTFLLGAALPTALFFSLASDRLIEGPFSISRGSGIGAVLPLGNDANEDCDMVWFRNPFRHFPVYADMSCSSDGFNPAIAPLDNPLNTGLYYIKSTNRSIEMMRRWRAARERFPGQHDQTVFISIRHELVSELQVKIEPLETVYFGGFCEYHDEPEKICTIHACCCIGLDNKVHDLKEVAADWNNYTSLTPEQRQKGGFKWTYPTRCRDSMSR